MLRVPPPPPPTHPHPPTHPSNLFAPGHSSVDDLVKCIFDVTAVLYPRLPKKLIQTSVHI